MISTVTGMVTHTQSQSIRIHLGPFGLELMVPDGSRFVVKKEHTVYCAITWNQENGPSFYGFTSELEKKVFLLITSCSGIGPRIALAAVANLGAEGFLTAISSGNEKALSGVSGIGAKKAEQMVVQLKHKVSQLVASGITLQASEQLAHWQTVTQALLALSYSRAEVNQAVSFLRGQQSEQERSFDQLMRQALSFLSKQS